MKTTIPLKNRLIGNFLSTEIKDIVFYQVFGTAFLHHWGMSIANLRQNQWLRPDRNNKTLVRRQRRRGSASKNPCKMDSRILDNYVT